ncbi:MAG: phage tail tape measure protein, partial [Actinomycetota bacterium]|nr:phage tail tape measure protein [Actinomycetota bacterium]
MIDLGETTNLPADEAATAIAQISNVMGTMERDGSKGVERFGATLVALGNAGASTEAEIVDMAKRIAGAAKLVGASESDVLALSNAMASVGIEAQLGGGVISRVMQRMYGDVKAGGEGLDNLAKVAGVSSKDFATAFETDPVRAVDMLVKGLGRVKNEGGNVVETMSDLGIKGTEETGVILRLAGAGDILTDSLKLGDSAWKSNSALAAEAAKRYETTESKVKVAWNNIKDAAIDAGAVILPLIAGVAESVAGIAQAFGNLPDPVKGALTILGGVAGVAALGAGAFLTLTPKILDSVQAFKVLAPSGGKASTALIGVGKAAGIAGAAYAAMATAAALAAAATEGTRGKTSVDDFNNALIGISKNGKNAQAALDGAFKGVLNPDLISGGTTAVNDFGGALDRVFHASWQDNLTDFSGTIFGQNATTGINTAKDAIGNYDKSLASMVASGNFEDAAAGFRIAAAEAEKNGDSTESLIELFPEYKDAILANKTANGETQVSQEALTEAMLKADP